MSARIAAWEKHYPWVGQEALAYFRSRVPRARRDGEEGLAFVVAHATSRGLQEACIGALVRKTEILWHLVDCVQVATGARRSRAKRGFAAHVSEAGRTPRLRRGATR
jgi:pyrroloquinoline quinone (PQQ) biosynthesis protein C